MTPPFRILLTAATPAEIAPVLTWLRGLAVREERNTLIFDRCRVEVVITGIGPVAAGYCLGRYFAEAGHGFGLAIQAGIAGAIDRSLPLESIVQVTSERFGDLGAQDHDGSWLSPLDLGFDQPSYFEPDESMIVPASALLTPFTGVAGLTVNQSTGSLARLQQLQKKWPSAQVETMEGASFFYACLDAGLSPVQLRAISNYVEARDRSKWRIGPAVAALDQALQRLLTPFVAPTR